MCLAGHLITDTMSQDSTFDRRRFLRASGIAGVAALAGCIGDDDDEDPTDDDVDEADLGEEVPTFRYYNNPEDYDAQRHDAINFIGEQFEEVGMDIDVEVLEWSTLQDTVQVDNDFDFATWWTFFFEELGEGLYQHFHSTGGENWFNYQNDDVDEWVSAQMAEEDEDARVEQIHNVQQQVMEDVPFYPICYMTTPVLYNNTHIVPDSWDEHPRGFSSSLSQMTLEMDEEDELVGAWPEALDTLNPFASGGESKHDHQFNILFDRLYHFDEDYEFVPEISLAEGGFERPDAETIVFEGIRDHVWHDGEELTVDDVAWTMNAVAEHEPPYLHDQAEFIDNAEVIDDSTVQVNLTEPLGPAEIFIGFQIPIMPEHIWADVDDPNTEPTTEENAIGSGPTQLDYWDQGTEISLERFDDHWHPVDYSRRLWRIIPEVSTVFELLEQGDLNYEPFGRVARETVDLLDDVDHLSGYTRLSGDFWHLSMNTETVDTTELRRAAGTAVPNEGIVEQFLFGFAEPADNVVSPAWGVFHTDDVPEWDVGHEAARELLSDAGYGWDDDGRLHYPAD